MGSTRCQLGDDVGAMVVGVLERGDRESVISCTKLT